MNKALTSGFPAFLFFVCISMVSCNKDSVNPSTPVSANPELTSVDKSSVINGEIITLTGKNFSKNHNGASQLIATNSADTVYLFILSRTATQLVAVMTGTGGGKTGTYNLSYCNKPDANKAKFYTSAISMTVNAAGSNQFFVSSTFAPSSVDAGGTSSFGVKHGTTTASDYTVKLVSYDYSTGASSEFSASVTGVDANAYGGSMDQVNFTVPSVDSGEYIVKVTYSGSTLVAGWNSVFIVD